MKYCNEEEFINNICIKDNNITKIQWLNNIIKFGEENCRFSQMAKFSSGEMIGYCTSFSNRYFYGLNKDGRFLFVKDSKETPYNSLSLDDNSSQNSQDIHGEIFVVKMEENGKQYILNFGRFDKYMELYDFEINKIYDKNMYYIYPLKSIRSSFFYLKEINSFVLAVILVEYTEHSSNSYLYICKYNLAKKESFTESDKLMGACSEKISAFGNMVSCYQANSKYIICFYISSLNDKQYKIIVINDITKTDDIRIVGTPISFNTKLMDENIFFKVIHYEAETGYYFYFDKKDGVGPYPIILIKHRNKDNEVEDFDKYDKNIIQLKLYNYDTSLYSNDFITLSKEIVCYSSISTNKEILYIITLNVFE